MSRKSSTVQRSLEEYLLLPYTIEVHHDTSVDPPGWVARVVELPGCITQADSLQELGEMIEEAMRLWIEIELEDGAQIPEPRPVDAYSGRFLVRMPGSIHRDVIRAAKREGVSLNAYINSVLAREVGRTLYS